MRCSKRWAKPLRPSGSSLLPTWYQMLTATMGALRSVWTITRRPLGSVNSSNLMSGGAAFGLGAGCATAEDAAEIVRRTRRAAAPRRRERMRGQEHDSGSNSCLDSWQLLECDRCGIVRPHDHQG